jgi:hypothetical protein
MAARYDHPGGAWVQQSALWTPVHDLIEALRVTPEPKRFEHADALSPRQALDALYRLQKLDGGG